MQSIKGLARSARNVFGDTFDKVTSPGQRSKADEHNASFRSRTLFSPTRSCEVNTGKTVRHQTKAANFLEATRTSRKTLLLLSKKISSGMRGAIDLKILSPAAAGSCSESRRPPTSNLRS